MKATRFARKALALSFGTALFTVGAVLLLSESGCGGSSSSGSGLPGGPATLDQVLQGRAIVISAGCSDCHNHNGSDNPSDPEWLAGYVGAAGGTGTGTYQIGPFQTYAANLTPDQQTGLGRYTEQQVFNALRYGLDPAFTPSVVISSTTPGQGNYPSVPHYLAPPMPWLSIRNMSDSDLWAIVAYLKHGIKPVNNPVPDSQGPPDFWASTYGAAIQAYPLPNYPAGNEQFSP